MPGRVASLRLESLPGPNREQRPRWNARGRSLVHGIMPPSPARDGSDALRAAGGNSSVVVSSARCRVVHVWFGRQGPRPQRGGERRPSGRRLLAVRLLIASRTGRKKAGRRGTLTPRPSDATESPAAPLRLHDGGARPTPPLARNDPDGGGVARDKQQAPGGWPGARTEAVYVGGGREGGSRRR